jgi:hypothetical protein
LGILGGNIKLTDQFDKPFRDPLPDDVIVHGTQLVAYSGLNLGI